MSTTTVPASAASGSPFVILEKTQLAPRVTRYIVRAPDVARARRAGQFVIVRPTEQGERIPLTIADADAVAGVITLVVQEVGKTTAMMASMPEGAAFTDLVGPLGAPTHIERWGRVVCIGGGIGIAPMHPIAQAMRAAGNNVVAILGARTKDLLIMEEEMRRACDEVMVCTDDGSYGEKGLVTDMLARHVASARQARSRRRDRSTHHDEVREQGDRAAQDSNPRESQFGHGRRHGDVRRLPRHRGRQDQVRLRRWSRVRRPPGRFRRDDAPPAFLRRAGASVVSAFRRGPCVPATRR